MLSLHQEFLDRKQIRVLCLLTPGNLNLILHLHFVVWIISSRIKVAEYSGFIKEALLVFMEFLFAFLIGERLSVPSQNE